jgi:hypothetical protein
VEGERAGGKREKGRVKVDGERGMGEKRKRRTG